MLNNYLAVPMANAKTDFDKTASRYPILTDGKQAFYPKKLSIDLWRLPDVSVIVAYKNLIDQRKVSLLEYSLIFRYFNSVEFKVYNCMTTAAIAKRATSIV